MRTERRRQSGVALIIALLVVAMAAIVAVAIMARAEAEYRRAQMVLHGEQALQYVFGAEHWVMQILLRDRQEAADDHFGQAWAYDLPPLPVDGGVVRGRLTDLNGRFNLNNLVDAEGEPSAPHVAQFRRLLQALGVADQVQASAVVDFIDADSETTMPDGAEDQYYLGTDPPHRAPNRPLASISELALLRDFDQALLPVIAPHVVALPDRTRLNVNTLSAPVLMSLGEDLSEPAAQALVDARADSGYASLDEFESMLGAVPEPGVPLGLASDWFMLTVRVSIGSTTLTMYSLLERSPDGPTRVVARRQTPW